MSLDGEFLFDNQLVSAIELLIKESKEQLILISPFIDFDPRIKTALKAKQSEKDFSLVVVLGKNEGNYHKSIKKESLEFLMEFPNVEIRYDARLHAKFYQNDFDFIMTSMNLYNFSLANNIEFGVRFNHSSKGLLGKVGDASNQLVDQGMSKIKEGVFGGKAEVDPLEKFDEIVCNSRLLYKTKPVLAEKGGISGMLGGMKLDGKTIVYNELVSEVASDVVEKRVVPQQTTTVAPPQVPAPLVAEERGKFLSASKLSKTLGLTPAKVKDYFEKSGFIQNDEITELGKSKGLVKLKGQYGPYIAYPEGMEEFKNLSR